MKRLDTTGYTFTPASKTVQFSQFSTIGLGRILLINNNTRGVVIYDPSQTSTNGSLAGSTLTLNYDTTTHSASDTLTIFYDDGQLPVSSLNPLPVRLDQGTNGVNENNGALQVENLGIEQGSEQLATTITNTGNDEPLQLVGLHPNYPLPIDTSQPLPIAGKTFGGAQAQVQVNEQGGIVLADGVTLQGLRSSIGSILVFDTTGYASVCIQITGTWVGTITFQTANDPSNWASAIGWTTGSAQAPISNTTGNNVFVFPTYAKFFRVAFTGYTSGIANVIAVLRAQQAANTVSTPNVNSAQISGTATVTAGVAGLQAVGGNIAPGVAPTSNPVPIGGTDGSLTRRILTDTAGNLMAVGPSAIASSVSSNPVQIGLGDLEGRVRRLQGDVNGRILVINEESGFKGDGVIDALNNVVRELKLLNARIADLPYFLGVNAVMPSDELSFRDDPTIFSI